MKQVRMNVSELLGILRRNRDRHHETFLKAQEVYRQAMITELDARLREVREGKPIRRAFAFPEPEEHTVDYDRVIRMLEVHVDDTITISELEFAQYVQDNWGWLRDFTRNTRSYLENREER